MGPGNPRGFNVFSGKQAVILIAHRGNVNGRNSDEENSPQYVSHALELGYHVELDVWFFQDKLFLGHDQPEYEVDVSFLRDERLWCHCKNRETLGRLINDDVHCFFHDTDDVALTSRGYMWVYPKKELLEGSICVLPELHNCEKDDIGRCIGICSDYIENYSGFL